MEESADEHGRGLFAVMVVVVVVAGVVAARARDVRVLEWLGPHVRARACACTCTCACTYR